MTSLALKAAMTMAVFVVISCAFLSALCVLIIADKGLHWYLLVPPVVTVLTLIGLIYAAISFEVDGR